MRPIDLIKKARHNNRRSVEVSEWGVTLYFTPLTTNDILAVEERMSEEDGKDPNKNQLEKRVYLLIQKAELEDGSRAFTWGDRIELLESAEWAVLQRVIAFMYASSVSGPGTLEDAKKKSEKTEPSSDDSSSESS